MSGLRESVVIGPERGAAMVLRSRQMQRVRSPQAETGAELGSVVVDGFRHRQQFKLCQAFLVVASQQEIAAAHWSDEALKLYER